MARLLKWSFIGCIGLMLLCVAGYVRWDTYGMDGDAVSFLDMSHYMQHGKPELAFNGYWNPAYSVALVIGDLILRPGRYDELHANYCVNAVIFVLALVTVCFLVRSIVEMRTSMETAERRFALSPTALMLVGCGMVFSFWELELSVARVRSDGLLCVFLMASAGFAIRLLWTRRWIFVVPLGLMLAGAYYTKAFGFVASWLLFGLLAIGLLLPRGEDGVEARALGVRAKDLLLVAAAAVVFLVAIAPYISRISHQRDRLTFGDSSRLLYSWFIDDADSIHEAYTHNMGRATNQLKHPERLLLDQPRIYSYDQHLNGTLPIWFDPAWWHDKTTPHQDLRNQIHTIFHNIYWSGKYFFLHGDILAALFLLVLLGYRVKFERRAVLYLVPMLWALGMWSVYLMILIEDRYVAAPYVIFLLPIFALLEMRDGGDKKGDAPQMMALAVVLMLVLTFVTRAVAVLTIDRGLIAIEQFPGGWYDVNTQDAARGLAAVGVKPGDRVACYGEQTCHLDPYWAYLAGAQIVTEMDDQPLPTLGDAKDVQMMTALASVQAKAIVGKFAGYKDVPPGWQQMGKSVYFVRVVPQP